MSQFGNLHAARMDPEKERYHNELYARQCLMAKAIFDYFKRPEAPEEKLDDVISGCYGLKETKLYLDLAMPGYPSVNPVERLLRSHIVRGLIRDAFQGYLIAKDKSK